VTAVPNSSLRLFVDSHCTSPYAMAVFVALHHKALPFELLTVDLEAGEQRGAGYSDLSLTQRVPTLIAEDFALSESSAICEYLEDIHPSAPLYPQPPQQRARARQLQAWLRSDLQPLRQERSTLVVFYGQRAPALSPSAQAAATKLLDVAGQLLADGREHLFGRWSIVDVELAVMLNRLVLNDDEVPPALRDYAQRQWQHPAVQAWVNTARPPL
jgi:glutathione S-transferase